MLVAVAAPSNDALAAAFEVAAAGGCAVDVAIAAAAVSMVKEIGVCAPGAGGFLTVGGRADPITYDGYMAVPGLDREPTATVVERSVSMEYGGGITTIVGPGSIATPGMWDAFEVAHSDHGRVPWHLLLGPASRLARNGFTLGSAVFTYLEYSHEVVFGDDPAVGSAIHTAGGDLIAPTDLVRLPDLAGTLDEIAEFGAGHLHGGSLGRRVATDLAARGSRITEADLVRYRTERRTPARLALHGWNLVTNPAPAVGGEALLGILERLPPVSPGSRDHLVAQLDVFERRRTGDALRSGSTIQVSVVDETGLGCSITASAGYGSGVVPHGTGLLMNNAMGELELLTGDVPNPGERLVSNMAPTIGTNDGSVLAIGSPGASRITSALAQVLTAFTVDGDDVRTAVHRPRLHVETGEARSVSVEPGVAVPDTEMDVRRYDSLHMYFGGVGAALRLRDGSLVAVADPRREGAAGVGPN